MRVTELFCGAGLAHRGIEAALPDAKCIAYDFNEDAVTSAVSNDIKAFWADLSNAVIRQEVVNRQLPDLLWASPPCQGFSSAGKRLGAADPRNGFPWVLDMLHLYLSRYGQVPPRVLIENVKGMTTHRGGRRAPCKRGKLPDPTNCPGCYLELVCSELREYYAHVEWRVLDAAEYGVPQHRRRLIIQCQQVPIVWPTPTHGPNADRPYVTMRDALPHLDEEARIFGGGTNPRQPDAEHQRTHVDLADRPSTTIAAQYGGGAGNAGPWILDGGRNLANHPRQERPVTGDEPSPAVSTRGNQVIRFLGRPSPTVDTCEVKGSTLCNRSDGRPRVNRASDALKAATGRRRLTVEECAILQGLDCDPTLQHQTKTSRYRQVGNGVPPQLVRAIIESK